MEFKEDQIQTLIKNALPEMQKQVLEETKRSLAWAVSNELSKETQTAVSQFIKDEIAPEMQNYLQKHKAAILEGVLSALDGIIKEVSTAILAKAKANLAQSYQRDRIVEAIFK